MTAQRVLSSFGADFSKSTALVLEPKGHKITKIIMFDCTKFPVSGIIFRFHWLTVFVQFTARLQHS